MNHCRLCGKNSVFVKSHVIPEAFFRDLRYGGKAPLLVAGKTGHLPKKAPIGVYDQGILCAPCEARFSSVDSYGIAVLLSKFDNYFKPLHVGDRAIAYQGDEVDTTRLLQFLVSILWRGSVSTQPFYSTVSLGPLEQVAREAVFGAAVPHAFNAVLSRWSDSDHDSLPTTGIINPQRERWGDVNAYRLYLGKVVAYVKVDQRSFVEPFSSLSLHAGAPCRIISRQLSTSKDLRAMRRTVLTAEENRERLRRGHRAAYPLYKDPPQRQE